MPYPTDASVPSYVPKKKRSMWREVWNSVYQEHGSESRAFAEANAAIKKSISKDDLTDCGSFQEFLEKLVEGNPLDECGIEDEDELWVHLRRGW